VLGAGFVDVGCRGHNPVQDETSYLSLKSCGPLWCLVSGTSIHSPPPQPSAHCN
jgi:hypothetical protein